MEDATTTDANNSYASAPPGAAPPVAGLLIRAREPEDCAAIAELVSLPRVRWGTLRMPFTSREETRQWIAQTPAGNVQIVAVLDGRVVGTAGIKTAKGRRNHVGMIGMCVHDDFQRRGIGQALLAALIDAADNWLNLRRLELTVYVDNVAAITLYEKLGFTIEGTRRQDAFRGGTFVDSYAMARLRDR
jgi:L-phenylalanine/L-methionine N-acetyltransferase